MHGRVGSFSNKCNLFSIDNDLENGVTVEMVS